MFARSLNCACVSIRLPTCRNTVQAKVLNCTGSQSDSLKPDSVVLKTKSVSFRTRVPLKPDSVIPKTLLIRCPVIVQNSGVCS